MVSHQLTKRISICLRNNKGAIAFHNQSFIKGFRMQKITPFLSFDGQAEEAMSSHISISKNSKVLTVALDAGPGSKGTVMTAAFQLDGQDLVALNGGP